MDRPRPFLKWAGGKRQLLAQFRPFLPPPGSYDRYLEPFLGGGALFFDLRPDRAILSDVNRDLIECYQTLKEDPDSVIQLLRDYPNDPDFFYEMRKRDPATMDPPGRTARTLYLNRTCYNGLYRKNSKGQFNVPFGRYKNPKICDADNLRAVSACLQGTDLRTGSFETAARKAEPEDFVYFDPPYHPLSTTSSFTAYTEHRFGEEEQLQLAGVFRELHQRGCCLMLSNSDTPLIRDAYAGFRIETVLANRAINSKSAGRGKIQEVLVLNY